MNDGDVIFCQECGRPWGARGLGVDSVAALVEAWRAWWYERCEEAGWRIDAAWERTLPPVPDLPTRNTTAVLFTDAGVEFLQERLSIDVECSEPDCWMDDSDNPGHGGVPEWWLAHRRKPWTRWAEPCCDLPSPPAPPATADERQDRRKALGLVRVAGCPEGGEGK